jgi:hypothetical protein
LRHTGWPRNVATAVTTLPKAKALQMEGWSWCAIEDDFRNFLRSEECFQTARLVEVVV